MQKSDAQFAIKLLGFLYYYYGAKGLRYGILRKCNVIADVILMIKERVS